MDIDGEAATGLRCVKTAALVTAPPIAVVVAKLL